MKTSGGKSNIFIVLKGLALGLAEVVPGVSGGTIAFITGIYETLINAIKSFDLQLLSRLKRLELKDSFSHINGKFLTFLGAGMFLGIAVGVFFIHQLIEDYPVLVWAFFFGLILGSVFFILRKIEQWSWQNILALILGTVLAYYITTTAPATGFDAWWYYSLSGAIAISALILPGISGSFILLILGIYTLIIHAVKSLLFDLDFSSLSILMFFGIGACLGLIFFSRVLSWAFKNHKDLTLALLTGLMLGSLNKIWPWKLPVLWLNDEGKELPHRSNLDTEELKLIEELNVLPSQFPGEDYTTMAICLAITGLLIVLGLSYFDKGKTDSE